MDANRKVISSRESRHSRRRFLTRVAAMGMTVPLARRAFGASKRPKVGVLITEFTYRSHAHVILENFLEPYLFNGRVIEPEFEIASLYVDQFPDGEMARSVAKDYGIPIFPTIAEALCLGGKALAVDAVLAIGEHGKYPMTDRWQIMYPRKRFFDETVAVFRSSGRVAPYFNDKHLSYRWDWANEMVDTARELKFGLMAGSSVPLAQRRPPMELSANAPIVEAVSIHGGGVESYDFHALEVLQSLLEARAGGETGVRSVQFVEGEALWKAADEGRWSPELARRAMAAELGDDLPAFRELSGSSPIGTEPPHGILIDYSDGTRGIALKVGSSGIRWNFAARLKDRAEPVATSFYVGPWQNRNLFKALSHAIQEHFRTGRAPYPVERTLWTSGVLAAAMDSRFEGGKRLPTPHLDIHYTPLDFSAMREMGKTWEIITDQTPEPMGLDSAKGRS